MGSFNNLQLTLPESSNISDIWIIFTDLKENGKNQFPLLLITEMKVEEGTNLVYYFVPLCTVDDNLGSIH